MKVFPDYTPPSQPNSSIVPVAQAPAKAGNYKSTVNVQKQINATLKIVDTDLNNS